MGYLQTQKMSPPDTTSEIFPNRPIRPLPKRRLRERLTPDELESVKAPQPPSGRTPLFHYPPAPNPLSSRDPRTPDRSRKNGTTPGLESDDDEASKNGPAPRPTPHVSRPGRKADQRNPNPPPSTTSSIDGYDTFENSNKKKRKIPSPGDHLINGSHTLAEIGTLAISHTPSGGETIGDSPSSYVGHSQGISGPGRGRYGRTRNGRSPLRALSDSSSNAWPRGGRTRPGQWTSSQVTGESSGIISSAIANAEKLQTTGQENISLLQQSATKSPSSQFTFTCEPQVTGSVAWPVSDTASSSVQSPSSKSSIAHNMQSTQTSPPRAGGTFDRKDGSKTGNAGANVAPRRPRSKKKMARKLDRELRQQAEDRRRETQLRNAQHPVPASEQYTCLYCEYEAVFGEEPWALIRQYEIKDRRRRREEAERKRLIEKAKMRSRKNRKPSKSVSKAGASPPASNQALGHDGQGQPTDHLEHGDDVTEEGYYDEGEDDDYGDYEADYCPHHDEDDGGGQVQSPTGGGFGAMCACVGHD